MEEQQFLKTVMDEAEKSLSAGGYKNIEYFDENLVAMNGTGGQNIDGEETVAKMLKPSGNDLILTLAYVDDNKYLITVTMDKSTNSEVYDKTSGDMLKRLAGTWGSKLGYRLDTWGGEIKSKDDRSGIKGQIQGATTMDTQLDETKSKMTGTTRSSYQKVGECKVIIRHTARVDEDKFGSRSRNINSIFIETKGGERFKMSENNLHGARAMARHLSNSGSPFDTVGVKITTMMEEMKQLRVMVTESKTFSRATTITEEQSDLFSNIKGQYITLRETLKKMSGKMGYMNHTAILDEENLLEQETGKMDVDTVSKAAKNKENEDTVLNDQVPEYDRPDDDKKNLIRDADDLFSVNENKYGVSPEEVVLEAWFNDVDSIEFFNEEDLSIDDSAPTIKKTLPENALSMLNLYSNHPLFDHYLGLYEEQEILDEVLSLIEEDSTLWNRVSENRGMLNEFNSDITEANFEESLGKIKKLTADRRMNMENAINQVSKEIMGDNQDAEMLTKVIEKLTTLATESGLMPNDFGTTFTDQVLAPNETIEAHTAEIEAEEYYGDAKFSESVDEDTFEEMNQIRKNAGMEALVSEDTVEEGDPFARQSKRNLANPKARMSLINPEDKIGSSTLGVKEGTEGTDDAPSCADCGATKTLNSRHGYECKECDKDTPNMKEGTEKYVEVEMPHHLPQVKENTDKPEISGDFSRMIELARYRN